VRKEVEEVMRRERVNSSEGPAPAGPYSHAIRDDNYVFVTSQLGIDPGTGTLVDGGTAAQARQAMENLSTIIRAAGSSVDKVVKTTVFLVDMGDYSAVDGIYAEFFSDARPARSTIQVGGLPLGALVGIDAVAMAS